MPARICSVPGCPNRATDGSRCGAHARPAWRQGSSTRKQTLPKHWPAIRAQVLARDGRCMCPGCPRCQGSPCSSAPTDADHVGDRDDHSLANLRSLCRSCHRHRSSSQGGSAKRW
jgi:5-methylcytosine-specific restriction endonuclease McrA